MEEQLIDEIYEAAFIPEKWEGVLEGLGGIAGCNRNFMFVTNGEHAHGAISTPLAREAVRMFIEDDWMPRNTMGQRSLKWGEPAFGRDFDLFTPEEIESEPIYREFLRPNGMGWCTGSVLRSPSDDAIIISLHRPFEEGPVAAERVQHLTALRPHIGRATLAAARLRLEQAKNTIGTLADIGLPAAALSRQGRLRATNVLFDSLVPDVAADHAERLRFNHRGADILFSDALRRGNAGNALGLSFPVLARPPHPPFVAHLVPVRRAAHDIFSAIDWLLLAIPVTQSGALDTRVLEGLFDLTPAEARVARGILFGKSLQEIAQEHSVSPETTRTQLKAVMAKTGTSRQSELASLLGTLKRSATAI